MTTAEQWLFFALAAAAFGAVGQILRMVAGLKKVADEASAKGVSTFDLVNGSRLVVSLLLGSAAGILAALVAGANPTSFEKQIILGCMAAGYSGTDFIEAMMSRFLPGTGSPNPSPSRRSDAQASDYAG